MPGRRSCHAGRAIAVAEHELGTRPALICLALLADRRHRVAVDVIDGAEAGVRFVEHFGEPRVVGRVAALDARDDLAHGKLA